MTRTGGPMARIPTAILAGIALLLALAPLRPAAAQKAGGVLKVYFFDSPATMSIHEESTIAGQGPMMGVFNNLGMYDQSVPQSGMKSIVPDLAREWSWDAAGTNLTFKLRRGVKWHDGKPFTARDVKCTWDLLQGTASETLRVNPRKTWYGNLDTVIANGDDEVTFKLRRPQPAFIALLASGFSPVYPCHVPPAEMRRRPIGTGPFKFVEIKPNESIKVARNPDYWKPGRPHLDGIDWVIVPSLSTRILGFIAGKFDQVFGVTIPLLRDLQSEAPRAVCEVFPANLPRTLLVNRTRPAVRQP